MNVAMAWICSLCTAGGGVLLFQEAGSQPWWDALWVLLLAVFAYAGLVQVGGLSRARMCAGVVLVVFSGIIILTALCGWPLGPLRFTGPSVLRAGNFFPLLPPLLAFSLLTLCQRALAVACPGLGINALASAAAGVFAATLLNGSAFLSEARLWWLWNPWGDGGALIPTAIGLTSMALAGFFLARIYPEDTNLKLTRWSSAAALLIGLNILFLAANALYFLGRL